MWSNASMDERINGRTQATEETGGPKRKGDRGFKSDLSTSPFHKFRQKGSDSINSNDGSKSLRSE